jgi:endo-1,4-beta-xylanase
VNEPINAQPPYKQALGGNGETGWDWVIWAFEKAREYCPDARLILNEYNVLHSSTNINKMIEIINLLKERDLIDAIGIQGHYFELRYYSITALKNGLDKLAETGLPIYISEFEINEEDDDVQVQGYQKYFPLLWEHPGVHGITQWGYIQDAIWQTNGYLIRRDGSERPAMEWLRDYLENSVSVKHPTISPAGYRLHQNFPNPFNPSTEIVYQLPEPGQIRMEIVNLSGQQVRALVDEVQSPGEYTVQWNACDDSGNRVPSGVYFYNLRIKGLSRSFAESKKMLLLK